MNAVTLPTTRLFTTLLTRHHLLRLYTTVPPLRPPDPAQLIRVATILYQQQHSPEPKLQTHLQTFQFSLTHEFFLQICNKFPLSWRPVYRFYLFTLTRPDFTHTYITLNKMLDIIGKSRNIDLLWEIVNEMIRRRFANDKTIKIALRTLAKARELKKCVGVFHLLNENEYEYSVDRLNKIVECLCKDGLVDEAKYVVMKLNDWIKPNGVTYKHLICGFCDVGDVIEASKLWNLMVDEGFEGDLDVVNAMMERFFKDNQFDQGLKLFQTMRVKRMEELGVSSYRVVIKWLCKRGKVSDARHLFDEMQNRGIELDDEVLGSIVYGLVLKNRVREANLMVEKMENPGISVYHGLIKGYLRLKKASEATEVFREMIRRGCEPIMHTYVMLLQGHLGRRGRKGNDPLVNFDTIFVGGLVKVGKFLEATKYVERTMKRGIEVPRFDYNKFLHYYSNEEGAVMFEEVGKKLREVGLFDLADIFVRYGEKMATRDRRRNREFEPPYVSEDSDPRE